MHTSNLLNGSNFSYRIKGCSASLENVLPNFNEHDRIGVIVRRPCGGTGASALLLATITRFYDAYRLKLGNEREKLRIYPELFFFHVGKRFGSHRKMDVWPPHREVVVENDSEQILEAINDRGITRLLVEDIEPTPATFLRETISSAELRILTCLAYSHTGRVNQPDVAVMSNIITEKLVFDTLKESKQLKVISEEEYEQILKMRQSLVSERGVYETYRRIEFSNAIRMLTPTSDVGPSTRLMMADVNSISISFLQ